MSLYVDSSALIKRYVQEPESDLVDEMFADPDLITAGHTVVELRRNLARLVPEDQLPEVRARLGQDLGSFAIVELDQVTCELAATIAETTGARSLDALHLAAAQRVGGAVTFLTFDLRQAKAARAIGLATAGA